MVDFSKIQELSAKVDGMKNRYNSDKAIVGTYQKQREEVVAKIETINQDKDLIKTKITLLQEASTEARNNAKDLLVDVTSNAVQMTLGDNLSIGIDLDTKDGTSSAKADVYLKAEYPNEIIETDPAEEEGGGVADMVALSSFLSIGQLAGRNNIAPKFLDEPTKYLSKGHSEKGAEFLKEMVEYTERQTFLITHDEYLSNVGDVAYKFVLDENGTTQYEKL